MRTWHCSIFLVVASTMSGQSPFQVIRPPAADTDVLAFRNPVPDFEVRDLSGRTWRSADLQGKLTVVQIWGTFCLPCRKEHPALQDFFNKAHSMNNVQVISVSLDGDRSRVLSYMKDKGFTFP